MSLPKICHIIHDDGPGGGPVLIVDQLVATSGHLDLSVIHGGHGKIAEYCDAHGIPHWQVSIDRQASLPWGLFQITRILKENAPDVVILHGQWAGPVGAIALKLARIRHSIYVCQWPSFYSDWDLGRILRNRISEALPCRQCDRVVTVSLGSWYQYSLRRLGAGKLRIIHNGIDLDRVPTAAQSRSLRAANGWDDRLCHVVSVGRLSDQKCVDWLLRSWQSVQNSGAPARLWIVGSGPEEAALHRQARDLKIEETCTFLGPRPNGIEYLAAADIVAMTTLYEGHATVPLEAMASGRPVVANDVDGIRDSIRDGVEGFLVPPAEIEPFAEKLLLLIRDPALRTSMGEAALARAARFSVTQSSLQYRLLIDEILKSPQAPTPI